jgi:hypothetical protein
MQMRPSRQPRLVLAKRFQKRRWAHGTKELPYSALMFVFCQTAVPIQLYTQPILTGKLREAYAYAKLICVSFHNLR